MSKVPTRKLDSTTMFKLPHLMLVLFFALILYVIVIALYIALENINKISVHYSVSPPVGGVSERRRPGC